MSSFALRHILFALICMLTLSACNENYSQHYLMTHPDVLARQIDLCGGEAPSSAQNSPQCKRIMKIRKKFIDYVYTRNSEPVRYGKYILDTQMDCVRIAASIANLQASLAEIKANGGPLVEIEKQAAKLKKLQSDYQEHTQELEVMLAAIGVDGP